jgi:hypothetical protein
MPIKPDAQRDPNTITSKVEEPFESLEALEGAHSTIDELEIWADAGLRWADARFPWKARS